jgi:hypothetical protein
VKGRIIRREEETGPVEISCRSWGISNAIYSLRKTSTHLSDSKQVNTNTVKKGAAASVPKDRVGLNTLVAGSK